MKSCPKWNKSPNLVTLIPRNILKNILSSYLLSKHANHCIDICCAQLLFKQKNRGCHSFEGYVETKKSTVNVYEKEEKSNGTVYESVLQTFVEKENYLSRLNSKLDKMSNLQTEENESNDKTSSFFSFSDSLINLTNIKFDLDSAVDINYFKKNLKVLSIKV